MRGARASEGDYRDWQAVDEWAVAIARRFPKTQGHDGQSTTRTNKPLPALKKPSTERAVQGFDDRR